MLTSQSWGNVDKIEARYTPWIVRLERSAAAHPSSYRQKVVAAGLFGYLVLGSVLAFPCVVMAFFFMLMLPLFVPLSDEMRLPAFVALTGMMLYPALRLSRTSPAGVALAPRQAPALFATVERLRRVMEAPEIHEVRICSGMNAGLVQQARWGGLTTRNLLILGLPMFYGLSAIEVEVVIAHELGHAAGAHNRLMAFVSGVRDRWERIGSPLPTGFVARLLRRFFVWYGPWFVAFSQVLLREQEFEADQAAVGVVGANDVASALKRFVAKSDLLVSASAVST